MLRDMTSDPRVYTGMFPLPLSKRFPWGGMAKSHVENTGPV